MTLTTSLALFGSMLVVALLPGPGILAVVARTLSAGFRHGASTSAGIVAGDYVYISLALLGLAALSEVMGSLFVIVKYAGALYLIWLGVSLALSQSSNLQVRPVSTPSHLASFTAGLVTTLGNPKAILFYLSFLPAFLDLSQISPMDAVILYTTATVAVGGVMLGYAYVFDRAKNSFSLSKGANWLRFGSGALLVGSGVFVASRG